jgi:hypothetical protein
MSKRKKSSKNQEKELMIIQCSMFYITLFLEQAGVIKNNTFVKDAEKDFEDIQGAIKLGKQLMFILSKVNINLQNKTLDKANKAMINTGYEKGFNYLVFVLTLLMEYKENFKNKIYILPISYNQLNTLYDEYFTLGLKDTEQMEVIKDSMEVASLFYQEVLNYGN